jgi:hypothetical protein
MDLRRSFVAISVGEEEVPGLGFKPQLSALVLSFEKRYSKSLSRNFSSGVLR